MVFWEGESVFRCDLATVHPGQTNNRRADTFCEAYSCVAKKSDLIPILFQT